jgi:SpoVK/Ycf46/Vps4 family AAA+-type ATPase
VRLLKDIALRARTNGTVVVLVSHRVELPRELAGMSARFELRMPDASERRRIIMRVIAAYQQEEPGRRVAIDAKALELLIENLSGLDHADTERLARAAVIDDGALNHSDLPNVMEARYQLLNASGALHFEYDTVQFRDVAGFANIKNWLQQRRSAYTASHPEALDPPKGILPLGVQGCGKSLAAKAAASVLGVPLLRLDLGTLYNKYHGETERNLRDALKTAEVLSPCVLWLDEIEKGLATDDSDSGTSKRVLGSLLTWMNDRTTRVLIVATANDIQALPPELIRKGRFDEVFFVDLPSTGQRREIFDIHLRKRGQDPAGFDCAALAAASHGFSGAEIEQTVVAALYAAHAMQQAVTARHLSAEIERTRPLSVLMAERVAALRAWAANRTVPADGG